jgi:hypothetical protein
MLERLHPHGQRRGVAAFVSANKTLLAAVWVVGFTLVFLWQSASISGGAGAGGGRGFLRLRLTPLPPARPAPRLRPTAYNLTEFGGVGDGRAVNTEAFQRAVEAIAALAERGGGQLSVPPGRWLTAPFNLTSHMTLFLAEGAEILGIPVRKLEVIVNSNSAGSIVNSNFNFHVLWVLVGLHSVEYQWLG